MLRYDITQLKASSPGRPTGYVEYVLQHGKAESGFVFLSDFQQDELVRQFTPEKFQISHLKANVTKLPPGFVDFILARGKIKGRFVEMGLDALDDLHEKFPVPTQDFPKEPTLAEMTANFTQAVAGWAKAGFKVVQKEVFDSRHATCKACEYWLPDARLGIGKCRKCGCSIYKLWMATSACPLNPPKWGRI